MTNMTDQLTVAGTDGASVDVLDRSTNIEKQIKEIPIHWIKTEGTQTRAYGLNQDTVDDYSASMDEDASFPAPIVYSDGTKDTDGNDNYWLGDGAHRLAAAKKAGFNHIKCEVRHGDKRAALKFALQANTMHGLRRSNQDKRHAVRLALADDEWGQWSHNRIAELCGVSAPTVASVVNELSANNDEANSTVNVLQLNPEDGASLLVTKSIQTGNPGVKLLHLTDAKRVGKDGKNYPATQQQQPAPDSTAQLPDSPVQADVQAPDVGSSPTRTSAATEQKPRNGKPVICSRNVQRALKTLSELTRNMQDLGLLREFEDGISAMIARVKHHGGMKPAPVAPRFLNRAPAKRPQPKPQQPQPASQIDKPPF